MRSLPRARPARIPSRVAFLALGLAILPGLMLATAPAAPASLHSVLFDLAKGRVGGLKLGTATQADVTARFGSPRRRTGAPGADASTRRLLYSCGDGCELAAQVDARRKLQLVWAYSTRRTTTRRGIRTRAGTYLGLTQASAEQREKRTWILH